LQNPKLAKECFFISPKEKFFFLAFFYFFTSHKTTSNSKQPIDDNNVTEGHLLTRGWRQALIVQVCKYRFHQLVLCKVDSSRFQIKARTPHPQNVEPQKVVLQFFNWALLNFFSEAKPIHFFTHF